MPYALLAIVAMGGLIGGSRRGVDPRFAGVTGEAYVFGAAAQPRTAAHEAFRGISGYAMLMPSDDARFAGVSGSAALFAGVPSTAQPTVTDVHLLRAPMRLPVAQ